LQPKRSGRRKEEIQATFVHESTFITISKPTSKGKYNPDQA